jgi:hypothetical protein
MTERLALDFADIAQWVDKPDFHPDGLRPATLIAERALLRRSGPE